MDIPATDSSWTSTPEGDADFGTSIDAVNQRVAFSFGDAHYLLSASEAYLVGTRIAAAALVASNGACIANAAEAK